MEDKKIDTTGSKLIELTSAKEVDKLVTSSGPLMIVYYAKWCPHCQTMYNTWKDLSNSTRAKIYIIESDDYGRKDVQGFPTMKIVKHKKAKVYDGSRDIPAMKQALLGGRRVRWGGTRRLGRRVRKTAHRTLRNNVTFV